MRIIGVMSGTSLDGIDAALVEFDHAGTPQLLGFHHSAYPGELLTTLRTINADTPLGHVLALDAELSTHYAQAVTAVCEQTHTPPDQVDAIGLHGQTVLHAPRATPAVTCQLGDPSRLAQQTGICVVADFRQRDLAGGGEGAPLAPLFHAALFAAESPRAVVNLGGIANLSVLSDRGEVVCGFDCGPANTLLDGWIQRHHHQAFDAAGAWAASGQVDDALLGRLQSDAFFARRPPKSTGTEYFNAAWLDAQLTGTEAPADVQATLAALSAWAIAQALSAVGAGVTDLIVTGGGAHNTDLIGRIAAALPDVRIRDSAAEGLPAEAIEAIGFAWLARATLRGQALDLTKITGARAPAILGGIYPA